MKFKYILDELKYMNLEWNTYMEYISGDGVITSCRWD
jgi:hypothetical protein